MAHHDKIIEGRIDELIELIDNSQIPRFGSADRRIVNADEIAGILVEIKSCLPENVRKANDVLARANKIMLEADEYSNATKADADRIAQDTVEKARIDAEQMETDANTYYDNKVAEGDTYLENKTREADDYYESRVAEGDDYLKQKTEQGNSYYEDCVARAKDTARDIIEEANATRERLVSESEVTLEAQKRAEELRRKTVLRSNQVYSNAKLSADSVLAELMDYLERYYSAIEADRKALDARPAATTGAQPRTQSAPAQNEAADGAGDVDEDDDASGWNIFGNLFKRKKKASQEDDFEDDDAE